jgi:hypothetical protein
LNIVVVRVTASMVARCGGCLYHAAMSKTESPQEAARRQRLSAALRENLKRRKAQAKVRVNAKAGTGAPAAETGAQAGNTAGEPEAAAPRQRP